MGETVKLYKGEMVRESAAESVTRTLLAEGWSLTPPEPEPVKTEPVAKPAKTSKKSK